MPVWWGLPKALKARAIDLGMTLVLLIPGFFLALVLGTIAAIVLDHAPPSPFLAALLYGPAAIFIGLVLVTSVIAAVRRWQARLARWGMASLDADPALEHAAAAVCAHGFRDDARVRRWSRRVAVLVGPDGVVVGLFGARSDGGPISTVLVSPLAVGRHTALLVTRDQRTTFRPALLPGVVQAAPGEGISGLLGHHRRALALLAAVDLPARPLGTSGAVEVLRGVDRATSAAPIQGCWAWLSDVRDFAPADALLTSRVAAVAVARSLHWVRPRRERPDLRHGVPPARPRPVIDPTLPAAPPVLWPDGTEPAA